MRLARSAALQRHARGSIPYRPAVAALMSILCAYTAIGCTTQNSSAPPNRSKPDISQLTESTILAQSEIKDAQGAHFFNGPKLEVNIRDTGSRPSSPPSCNQLDDGPPNWTQQVRSTWNNGRDVVSLVIGLTTERPDFRSLLSECQRFTIGKDEYSAQSVTIPGLPDWATSYELTRTYDREGEPSRTTEVQGIYSQGYYRGVLIYGFTQHNNLNDAPSNPEILADLFNSQARKLDNT